MVQGAVCTLLGAGEDHVPSPTKMMREDGEKEGRRGQEGEE